MKAEKIIRIKTVLRQILTNAYKLFGLAWAVDKRITFLYYFTGAIGALGSIGVSFVLKLLLDQLQRAQTATVPTIPLILILVLATRYLIPLIRNLLIWSYNESYLGYIFRYKLQNEITLKFHQKISNLDIAYFENPKVQDLITKTRDTMQWRLPDFMRIFLYLFRDIIGYVAAFIVLILFGWWIPLIATIITVPRLYLRAKYGDIQWSIWGSGAPHARKLWYFNYLLQEPTAVREIRISQSADALLSKFKNIQHFLYELNKKPLDAYLRVSLIPPLLEVVIIILISYKFLPSVTAGTLTIGSFILLINMLEDLSNSAAAAAGKFGELYEDSLYIHNYFEFLALPPLINPPEEPVILEEVNKQPPKIEFRNVSFQYPDRPKVLHNISFIIEPGESVALVGPNGAGKTTIIKLLCRFYDVSDGEILINDINIKKLDLSNWYKFLGTLFQEFVHYHFSVRDNITLGAPEKKDDEAMVEAAKKSGAAEFIEKFPKKYDQILGREFEEGEELSGGQWQKLAIARAFYEEPPVLILDEPTSAIDAEAEYEIFNNLEKQYKNKTLILVSHRFSTVRNASKILVIDNGEIIESGSHDKLMKLGGKYATMFTVQAKGYK